MRYIHKVTCIYCHGVFDRDVEPFQQVSTRRYAHFSCYKQNETLKTKEQKDKEALEEYIKHLFNETQINAAVRKQINDFIEVYNYSYSGILNTLKYFYEVKHGDISKANNRIGIVPYVYDEAYRYYYSLWLAREKNSNKNIEDYTPQQIEISIPYPKKEVKKRKLFTFLDDEGEE